MASCFHCFRKILALVTLSLAAVCTSPAVSQEPDAAGEVLQELPALPMNEPGDVASQDEIELPAEPALSDLLKVAILETLPETFINDKHWGRQEERFDGLKVRGLKISKREKLVNHGFWHRYSARLLEPEENLQIEIRPLEQEVDGRSVYDVFITVRAETEARFAIWTWGVKGLNGTVRSYATIRAAIRLMVAPQARLNWSRLVPQVGLDIKVHNVDLQVVEIDATHVGAFGGWVAEQLGDGSKSAVEALVNLQEKRVAARLQARFDKLKLPDDSTVK